MNYIFRASQMKKEKYGFTNPVGPLSVKDIQVQNRDENPFKTLRGFGVPKMSAFLRTVRGALANENYNTYNVLPAS